MVTKDENGQYFENGIPVFSLGQLCKFINYPTGRTIMLRDFREWKILLKRNEPSERMKSRGYFIYHLHEFKSKTGVKIGQPICLVTMEGVVFLRKYVQRKLASGKLKTSTN